jgi:hypothetical protein
MPLTLHQLHLIANKALDKIRTAKNLKELTKYNEIHSRLVGAMYGKFK